MASEPIATIPVDGGRIACRRLGSGRPLLVLNGLAATSADWDPFFVDRLASANEIILLDNRGIGLSTDNGAPFDIARLVDCSPCCFPAISPSPFTRSSATSLRPRAHSCLLTSSAGRLPLWTLGIA